MIDFPDDISVAAWIVAAQAGAPTEHAKNIIAMALLDERDRCASIAANWKSALRPGTEARLLGHKEAAHAIAEAILEPTSSASRLSPEAPTPV
ncbi:MULTISPECIES: hypothetical protein [Mesorhizobium]|uniref:hypothetical protein n=1 Tax=Mesorhizobium TaxID=68287 RepID=UPI0010A95B61|nr:MULTISPECIES: hypothetical protein [Mesorhizobium]